MSDRDYPYLIKQVMEHIEKVKETEKDTPLLDIIYDFCFKNDIEVEKVGDAIASDVYFKSFIEKDCELHRMISTENNKLEEW